MDELWKMTDELHYGDALQCNLPDSIITENEKKSGEEESARKVFGVNCTLLNSNCREFILNKA